MIQSAAAMIGYNNAVRTAKNSFAGIVWRQNTFDNEFACPSRADASHVIPCETRPRFAVGYRSEEHTSELQSLMRISYAVFCLKKKIKKNIQSLTIIDRRFKLDNN